MNLGQAVAVCCYELQRLRMIKQGAPKRSHETATAGEVEELLGELTDLMTRSGFFPPTAPRLKIAKLRRTLLGLRLSEGQVEFFRGAVAHVLQRVSKRGS